MNSWIVLSLAIASEVAGTTMMKLSEGLSHRGWIAPMLVAYLGALLGLSRALTTIDVGVAYAVWAGLGTLLVAVIGVVWFAESMTPFKVVSMLFVIVGVLGLHLTSQKVAQ